MQNNIKKLLTGAALGLSTVALLLLSTADNARAAAVALTGGGALSGLGNTLDSYTLNSSTVTITVDENNQIGPSAAENTEALKVFTTAGTHIMAMDADFTLTIAGNLVAANSATMVFNMGGTGDGTDTLTLLGTSSDAGFTIEALNAGGAGRIATINMGNGSGTMTWAGVIDLSNATGGTTNFNTNGATISGAISDGAAATAINWNATGATTVGVALDLIHTNAGNTVTITDGVTFTTMHDFSIGAAGKIVLGTSTAGGTLTTGHNNADLITGLIDGPSAGVGILDIDHAATITSNIGASNSIATIDIAGVVATFSGTIIKATNVNFSADGTMALAADAVFTGNIKSTAGNRGTLTVAAATQDTIVTSGNVGITGGFELKAITIVTGSGSAIEQTFTGQVASRVITLTGTGTVNFLDDVTAVTELDFNNTDSFVVMAANKKIIGIVDASSAAAGSLVFNPTTVDTTVLVSGAIGAGQAIKMVKVAPGTGVTAHFGSTLAATNFQHNGAGTMTVASTIAAATVISAGGTLNALGAITGAVNNTSGSSGSGTLTLGDQIGVSGAIGTTNPLLAVTSDSTSGTTAFGNIVRATSINLGGVGITTAAGDMTGAVNMSATSGTPSLVVAADQKVVGAITFTTTNINKVDFVATANSTTVVSAGIGAEGKIAKEIEVETTVGASVVVTVGGDIWTTLLDLQGSNAAAITRFTGDVNATTTNFTNSTGSVMKIADGKNINGAITTTTTNKGTLTSEGTTTVTGNIGAAASTLKLLTVIANGGAGKTLTVGGNVYTTLMTVAASTGLKFSHATAALGVGAITCTTLCTLDVGTATVAVAGAADMNNATGGTFKVTIGTTNGQLNATGAVSIDATSTLTATIKGAVVSGADIIIARSSAPITVPATVTQGYARYTLAAKQSTNDLVLTATVKAPAGVTGNSLEVNKIADAAFASDATMATALNGLTGAVLDKALATLAPSVSGGAIVGAVSAGSASGATISTQIASLRGGIAAGSGLNAGDGTEDQRFWTQGFGAYADQDMREKINGFTSSTGGVAFGVDKRVSSDVVVGFAYSFSHTNVDTKLSRNATKVKGHQATFYGTHDFDKGIFGVDGVFLDGQLSYAYNDYSSARYIDVGSVTRKADGSFQGGQVSTKFDLGRTINLSDGARFTPTMGLSYTHINIEAYDETNAGDSSLKMAKQDYDVLSLNFKGKLAKTFQVNGADVTPEIHLGYSYETIHDQIQTTSTFTGGGDSFKSTGFETADHTYLGGMGVTFAATQEMPIDLTFTYDASVKDDFSSHSGLVKGSYRF